MWEGIRRLKLVRVAALCAAMYLLISMNCALQRTSNLRCLAFHGQLYGQTEERKWCVTCLLPKVLRLTVKPADHKLPASPTARYWRVVVWLPVIWWQLEPSPFLSSVHLCEVEPGISFESHYQLLVLALWLSLWKLPHALLTPEQKEQDRVHSFPFFFSSFFCILSNDLVTGEVQLSTWWK